MQKFKKEFLLAKKIVIDCNKELKKKLIKKNKIIEIKKDIKSELDKFSHNYITTKLKKSNICILSEEQKNKKINYNELMWIIDPIDGTFNLTRGFNIACISISLWKNFKPIFGIVKNIYNNDIYFSYNNISYKNDKKINVSKELKISQSCLATGFPVGMNYSEINLKKFLYKVQKFKKIRMIGSAAMSLCHVATGSFDAYYENDIFLWDIAAGLSLVKAAGGEYMVEKGSNNLKFNVRASNKKIINKF